MHVFVGRHGAIRPRLDAAEWLKGKLADAHPRIERHGHNTQVSQLHDRVPVPSRVENAGSAVHDDPEPSQTAAPLETSEDTGPETEAFDCTGQYQLAGMDCERLTALDFDRAC